LNYGSDAVAAMVARGVYGLSSREAEKAASMARQALADRHV
jgi:hypothetical protein